MQTLTPLSYSQTFLFFGANFYRKGLYCHTLCIFVWTIPHIATAWIKKLIFNQLQRRPLSAIIHNRIFMVVDLIGEIWFFVNFLEIISYSMFCLLHGHICYQSCYGHKKNYQNFHTDSHICLNWTAPQHKCKGNYVKKLVKFSAATDLLICYCCIFQSPRSSAYCIFCQKKKKNLLSHLIAFPFS